MSVLVVFHKGTPHKWSWFKNNQDYFKVENGVHVRVSRPKEYVCRWCHETSPTKHTRPSQQGLEDSFERAVGGQR